MAFVSNTFNNTINNQDNPPLPLHPQTTSTYPTPPPNNNNNNNNNNNSNTNNTNNLHRDCRRSNLGGGRRKVVPRRHTVGGAQIQEHMQLVEDTDKKREAFYDMLASRYPQYADKITGLSPYHINPPVSAAAAAAAAAERHWKNVPNSRSVWKTPVFTMLSYLKRKTSLRRRNSSSRHKSEEGKSENSEEAGADETSSYNGSERSERISIADDVPVTPTDDVIIAPESDVIDLDAEPISADMKSSTSALLRHVIRDELKPVQNSRPREPQRRRTTVPAFSPYTSRSLDYDDPGTMSEVELSSFQRGGYARASMPIVRSASTSLERPMGLVFLVYHDETKKALLPNEITSLDTVRALFVRAFSDKLSMEHLDSPKRKIYILETSTSIFFQLEDLRDIKDRTVLRIHECDSDEPQYVKCPIEIRGRATQPVRPLSHEGHVREAGPHFRDEMVKAQSLPVSSSPDQTYQEMLHKERLHWEREQEYIQAQQRRSRSRSLTPEPAERPRSLSAGPPRGLYSHSPDRLPTPERGPAHLNTIPENPRLLANGFRQATAANGGGHYDVGRHPHGHPASHGLPSHGHIPPHGYPSAGHHASAAPPPPGRILSPPPVVYESVYPPPGAYSHPQAFVTHSTRAPAQQGPQRAMGPHPHPDKRGATRAGPPHRQSLPFAAAMTNPVYDSFPQRSQPYRVTPERDVLPPRPHSATSSHEGGRMERMEAQIASLAAWVHQVQAAPGEGPLPAAQRRNSSRSTSSGQSEGTDTYPASSASSLSDIPDACTKAQNGAVTPEMREKMNDMHCRMQELRVELQGLRRMEQLHQEAMREAFTDTLAKIKKVLSAVPGAEDQVVRQQRLEVNSIVDHYRQDRARVEKELSDLESSVEELKQDVLARKCRVNISDIEGLALVLSNITKTLADLKARYPKVHESLRKVMAGEMEIVVKEEKFIKEEPQQIEAALKRCKKLTSTLYTLKRLATVQDSRPPHVPALALESKEAGEEEKMAILESIRAMVPDHDTRVQNLEVADASRERKKKIVTQQESLKFTKYLQTASKALRPPDTQTTTIDDDGAHCSQERDPSRKSGEAIDSKRVDYPTVPAKPARLMLIDEPRHSNVLSTPSPSPILAAAHTVTVTSQICEKKEPENKAGAGSSARLAFFSSLESSPSVVSPERSMASVEMSPTVTVSAAASSSPGFSQVVPVSSVHFQPTRRLSASDSPYQATEEMDDPLNVDRGRKVPPPPPPRKSSARYPYGIGPLSPQSPSEARSGGPSLQRQHSGDKSPDRGRQKAMLAVYKAHTPTTTTTGPLSSTPKPPTPHKPANLSKLHKGGSGGQGRQPNLQHQRVGADGMLTTFVPPVPAALVTNNQDPILDDGDLSESESTGSTTSLDSQQGASTLVRTNSTPLHRGPKPHPPQRYSSLSTKESPEREIHVLEVKKPLRVDSMTVQVNGLDRAQHGHKT
ncbi:hypothetical protein ACOMHN_045258 [Nucella lapillus]